MEEQATRPPTPLEEKIAQTLHECEWHQRGIDAKPPAWSAYPDQYRELWRRQARCVIDALDLGYTSGRLVNLTGGADIVVYKVEGQWAEAGGAR